MSASTNASKPSGVSPSVNRPGVAANSCSLFKELAFASVRPKRFLQVVERADATEERRVMLRRYGLAPGDPVIERCILGLEQRLILSEFLFVQ